MELRELTAFVAVAEECGMSAASRRIHISQSALSQTVSALERELGVQLLVRTSTGVRPTEAGMALLGEARAILARRDQAVRTMAEFTSEGSGVLRLGVPIELPAQVLARALAKFATVAAHTQVVPKRLSTAAQFLELRAGTLDVGLVRERPTGREFDTMLVTLEHLGVYLSTDIAAELVSSDGVRLDTLAGLRWIGFARARSPAWWDQLTAILHSHGIDIGPQAPDDLELIAAIKFAGVGAGASFALAPPQEAGDLPDSVVWAPLIGNPIVRRTWVVWPANSRRRDLAQLVASFDVPMDA